MAERVAGAEQLRQLRAAADAFRADAMAIFAGYESSPHRVITLEASRTALAALSISQDKLFDQALRCVELGLFRASVVLAWSAFMDFLEETLASDGLKKLHAARPGLAKNMSLDELRDSVTDYEFIVIGKDVGLLSRPKMKTLHGLLSQRNESAHPGSVDPGVNEALGYIAKLFSYIDEIQHRTL